MRIAVLMMGLLLVGSCGLVKMQGEPNSPAAGLPVEVEGNKEIPLGRVRAAIAAGDMSSEESINKNVVALYKDQGFLEVKSRTTQEAERILVVVDEGAKFSFGVLRVDGGKESELPSPSYKSGDTFSRSKTDDYVAQIKKYYLAKDQEAQVNPVIDVKSDERVANVTIEIRIAKAPVAKAPTTKSPTTKPPSTKPPATKPPPTKPPATKPPVPTPPVATAPPANSETRCVPTPNVGRGESLTLRGKETINLGIGTYRFSRICLKGHAKIRVCSQTRIVLTSSRPSVIGGDGIGGFLHHPATIHLRTTSSTTLHVLFSNKTSPVKFKLDASRLKLFHHARTGIRKVNMSTGRLKNVVAAKRMGYTHDFPFCH